MIYYMTEPGGDAQNLLEVVQSIYEAALGVELPDGTTPPQNDGEIQCHIQFEWWPLVGGGLKPGTHGMVHVYQRAANPDGVIGEQSLAALAAAGIEVLRDDQIDAGQLALLPKFQ